MSSLPSISYAEQRCAQLSHPDIPATSVSVALLIWLVLSYLPQYFRIIARQSAAGLSGTFLLLGSISGICGIGNIIALPSSQVDLGCCKKNARFACIAGLMGMVQIILGFGFYLVLVYLYVYYTRLAASSDALKSTLICDDAPSTRPKTPTAHNGDVSANSTSVSSSTLAEDNDDPTPTDPEARLVAAQQASNIITITLVWSLMVLITTALVLNRFPSQTSNWANFLGLLQMGISCVQWFPQLWTTWQLGSLGSLSTVGLLVATPGTFVWIGSLFARVGWAGWSAWIVFVIIAAAQCILLVFSAVFKLRRMRVKREAKQARLAAQQGESDERTALLR